MNVWVIIGIIIVFLIVLSFLFFFLHVRVEKLADKLRIAYSNIDTLHKNQEELLGRYLKLMQDEKKNRR